MIGEPQKFAKGTTNYSQKYWQGNLTSPEKSADKEYADLMKL